MDVPNSSLLIKLILTIFVNLWVSKFVASVVLLGDFDLVPFSGAIGHSIGSLSTINPQKDSHTQSQFLCVCLIKESLIECVDLKRNRKKC